MALRRCVTLVVVASLATGCATTIAPNYTSQNPDIMRIGGSRPDSPAPLLENTGSFCVQVADQWHDDGKTPDGQTLWAKDTIRNVVPCK